MSDGNFAEFITRERDRLNSEREAIFTEQQELERKLDAINREFSAIDAYQSAKSGKAVRAASNGGGMVRARKGSRREELLKLITGGGGLSRGDILTKMGLKGDKAGEMSISNALTALTKANQVRRDGGKYHPA